MAGLDWTLIVASLIVAWSGPGVRRGCAEVLLLAGSLINHEQPQTMSIRLASTQSMVHNSFSCLVFRAVRRGSSHLFAFKESMSACFYSTVGACMWVFSLCALLTASRKLHRVPSSRRRLSRPTKHSFNRRPVGYHVGHAHLTAVSAPRHYHTRRTSREWGRSWACQRRCQ
jgi:hypothetical protein